MASVKSVTVHSDRPWTGGLKKRRYEVTLTDNFAADHVEILMPVKVLDSDDGTAVAADLLQSRKNSERGSNDIAPQWNDTQADYDRRSLGYAMTLTDVDEFYSYLPLFKAMEARGGANANQRRAYLGVLLADYNLMADRFGDVEGIAFFLDNAKGQVWEVIPGEFK